MARSTRTRLGADDDSAIAPAPDADDDAEPRRRQASRSDRRKNNLQPAPACSAGITRSAAKRRRLSRWMPRYSEAPRVSSQSSQAALSGCTSLSMTLAATRSASCDMISSKPNPLGDGLLALPVAAERTSRRGVQQLSPSPHLRTLA